MQQLRAYDKNHFGFFRTTRRYFHYPFRRSFLRSPFFVFPLFENLFALYLRGAKYNKNDNVIKTRKLFGSWNSSFFWRDASITLKLNYSSIICAISGTIFGTTLRKESVRRVCTLSENRVPGIRAAPLLRATGFAGSVAWRNRACWREREVASPIQRKREKRKKQLDRSDRSTWRKRTARHSKCWPIEGARFDRAIVRCDWRLSNYQGTASGQSIGKRTERRFRS